MLAILVRPFIAFALFFVAAVIGRAILRRIPPGRLRTWLGRPMPVFPRTDAERRDWWPVILLLGVPIIFLVVIWFMDPLRP